MFTVSLSYSNILITFTFTFVSFRFVSQNTALNYVFDISGRVTSIHNNKRKYANSTLKRFSRVLINYFPQKLSRRLSCLHTSTALYERDRRRAREILSSPDALHYISSEKSCEDDAAEPRSGLKPRKIRKLSWERSKLRNIKAKLDEAYLARLTEKRRHTSTPVSRTEEESSRPHPTNGPRWVVRSG